MKGNQVNIPEPSRGFLFFLFFLNSFFYKKENKEKKENK